MANGFRRYALAVVCNLQHCVTVFSAGSNNNIAIWLIVLNGIGKKICDELVDAVRVAGCFSAAKIKANFYVALFGKRADAVDAHTRVFC